MIAETKLLQRTKKEINDRIDVLKNIHKEMEKQKMEERIGKLNRPIWNRIEQECYVNFRIEYPYYYGGKCNGKAMLKFFLIWQTK